jgi:hypothetical protein
METFLAVVGRWTRRRAIVARSDAVTRECHVGRFGDQLRSEERKADDGTRTHDLLHGKRAKRSKRKGKD